MRARRLLALILAVATFGLAELAAGHGHPQAAGAGDGYHAAAPGEPAANAPCALCPGLRPWRGAAPSEAPGCPDAPSASTRPLAASGPLHPPRTAPGTAGGPRAPPALG